MNRLGQPTVGRGSEAQAGQPVLERLQLRFRPFGTQCLPGLNRQALRPGLGFKRIQTSDPLQRLGCHRMLPPRCRMELKELAPRMGPARLLDHLLPEERLVTGIVIDHQMPRPIAQEVADTLT